MVRVCACGWMRAGQMVLWKQEPLRSQVMWEHWDHEASLTDILRVHEVSSHLCTGKGSSSTETSRSTRLTSVGPGGGAAG